MILRRPYAFLVKHFKLIHAILLLGACFLVFKSWNIVNFLSSYIKDGISSTEAVKAANSYASFGVILVSALMAILSGIIIYLLRYKNKSVKLYLYTLSFYVLLTALLIWLNSFIADLGYSNPGIRFISILRDIIRFSMVLNVLTVALCFIRAIGFDLKRFDFSKDLLELGVNEEDNEEYEFELKIDKDKIKSRVSRGFRYTKYFYKENKFLFLFIGFLIIFIIFASVFKTIISMEKVYKQNQYFETNTLKMKVLDSYKTKTNNFGNVIDSGNSYVIVKLEIQNKQNFETTISDNILRLSFGEYELIAPTKKVNSKFTEFGVNYYEQTIKPYEKKTFNFIYEVPDEFYYDNFYLKCLYDITYAKGEIKYKYRKVKLSPISFDSKQKFVTTKTIGEELSFNGSLIGDTRIIINNVELNDSFKYNVIKCDSVSCINRKNVVYAPTTEKFDMTLMRINYDLKYDYNVLGDKYDNDLFITKFGSIRFEVNGKEYNNRLELDDLTPYHTGNFSIVQVRDKLKLADKVYLDFNIRDKRYSYVIIDKTKKNEEREGE